MAVFRQMDNFIINEDGTIYSKYLRRNIAVREYKKNKQGKDVPYCRVFLKNNSYALHRVIAECFVPNPENKPHVNHKDGNRFNNHKDNLEWVTHKENIEHAINNDLHVKGERHGIAIATVDIVKRVDEMRLQKMTYPQIAEELGMKVSTIGAIGRRQNWKHV